jgi:hypothetical protein
MVVAFHPNILRFLSAVHRMDHTGGIEELLAADCSLPNVRTVYRWHEELGDGLTYYPSIAFNALGLLHLHLLIEEPTGKWDRLVYAVRASWLVRRPGSRLLYLHCLVPRCHEAEVRQLLEDVSHLYAQITIITSHDGWQAIDGDSALQTNHPPRDLWDVVERYPLIVPVVMESIERRRSLPELWSAIIDRLGPRVWEYLPRFSRRMPHNGKTYVREALRLINDSLLFRQYVIRYAAYDKVTVELVLRCRATPEQLHALAGPEAPIVEFFLGDDEHVVRVRGTLRWLAQIFTARDELQVEEVWFADRTTNEHEPLDVRFAHELLFDPASSEWLFPRDEITFRLDSR